MALTRFKTVLFWVPALLALGLAFWLRTESSQLRLFHADEGVQSYQAWRLIEWGEYRYDPGEHHGPLLYYVAKWMAPFLVEATGELSDSGMRRVPMLFSLATLALGVLAFRRHGVASALLWGLFFAATPLSVIYGSYFVQEILLTCFTLALLLAVYRYWHAPSWGCAAAVGFSLGLMHVTKETAVLHVSGIGFSAILVYWIRKQESMVKSKDLLKHASLAVLIVLLLHCVFFSSFFQNPGGIVDGVSAFFSYAERSQGQGHEKPFLYYLGLLLPQKLEGVSWGELAFVVAVVLGVVRSVWKIRKNGFAAFLILSGLSILVLYSIIPYKNPWLLLTPYSLLAYAAAVGIVDLFRMGMTEGDAIRRWSLYAAGGGLLLFVCFELRSNLEKAVYQYASATRNPYLYMHTTPRYSKLLNRLETVKGQQDISIYSLDASWPLPWHLRAWNRVGYRTDLVRYETGGIDLIDTRLLADREDLASDGGFWELHGLRPNTLLALRASDEIAQQWIDANAKD